MGFIKNLVAINVENLFARLIIFGRIKEGYYQKLTFAKNAAIN